MQTLYYQITSLSAPFLENHLKTRLKKGKEDPVRFQEKMGIPSKERPSGQLLWIHAASVGEAQSALILIDKCRSLFPDISIMVTTITLSSAQLMEKRLPAQAFHQFCPLDHPIWVEKFLSYWSPDFVLWMESELWPNILNKIKQHNIPAILVNARMSEKSYSTWRFLKFFIQNILDTFDIILCQTQTDYERYFSLGAKHAIVTDNIKYSAKPLDYNKADFDQLSKSVYSRPLWVCASTHDPEEEIACRIHEIIKFKFPDLLTIIIPRHPERREDIVKSCEKYSLKLKLRGSEKNLPTAKDDIYIADTFGELGLFYRICPIAFIGRSLSKDGGGGHNPIEPAQLGCIVIHGKNIQNLQEIYDDMDADGSAIRVKNETELTGVVFQYLSDHKMLQTLQDKALKFSKSKASAIDRAMAEIKPRIEKSMLKDTTTLTGKGIIHAP